MALTRHLSTTMARTRPPDPQPRSDRGPRQEDHPRRGTPALSSGARTPRRHDRDRRREAETRRGVEGDAPGRVRAGQPGRIGIFTAVRLAFRPLDLRGDLRALPRLVRNKALWLPILLTLGATAVFLAVRPQTRPAGDIITVLAIFLFQYFIQTPAIGGVFIAGFLAPRASWLLGVIVGLVSAVCYAGLGPQRRPRRRRPRPSIERGHPRGASSSRRSWARSSHPRLPGIAGSCSSRARTEAARQRPPPTRQ